MGLVDEAYSAADDALQNQAELSISPIPGILNFDNPIKFRVTEFSIPEFSVGEYEVHWKTQKFSKPSGKIESNNEFEFSLRVDKYWVAYQALLAWFNFTASSDSGKMAEDVGAITKTSGIRTDVIVNLVDSNGIVTFNGWQLHKCRIKSLGQISFSQESGDPVIIPVTLAALKITPA